MHDETVERGEPQPYEAVIDKVRSLGSRLRMSEIVFPIPMLLPMLERYALEHQRGVGPATWVVDLFLDLEVPHETLYTVLEAMFYNDEAPFHGPNRRYIASDLLYLIQHWFHSTVRMGGIVFGSDVVAARVSETLSLLREAGLSQDLIRVVDELRIRIEDVLR